MQKFYTNISLMATPTDPEHLVNKKYVDELVERKLREILGKQTEDSQEESPSDKG